MRGSPARQLHMGVICGRWPTKPKRHNTIRKISKKFYRNITRKHYICTMQTCYEAEISGERTEFYLTSRGLKGRYFAGIDKLTSYKMYSIVIIPINRMYEHMGRDLKGCGQIKLK